MKILILSFIAALLLVFSCNTSVRDRFLSVDNLPLQEYTIDINKDTTLVTKNGALLKIPKGSLSAGDLSTVTLEIKEAYSIEQMINGGLVTESDGEPLSSGGMIYVNAKAGQVVKITQAIKVATPADYLAQKMKLFKGEKEADGTINWKEPAPLPENKQLNSVEQGQVLFQSKCASCHAIGKDLTGPNLAHIISRFISSRESEEGRFPVYPNFIHDEESRHTDSTRKEGSGVFSHYWGRETKEWYTCNLIKMYGSVGPDFNDLTKTDIGNIYRYIQNESDRRRLDLPSHAYLKDCADSCALYYHSLADLQVRKSSAASKKKKLLKDNGGFVERKDTVPPVIPDTTRAPANVPADVTPPVDFDEMVSPKNYEAEFYQFTIESFGWFNVDILLKQTDGVKDSELFVRITGQYRDKIKIYLIIPSMKANAEGGPTGRNPDEFAFYQKDGKIPLPQDAKAYILAITETEETIAFALKEFTTTLIQEFDISLNLSTREEFSGAIENMSLDKLHIKISDTRNAGEIRKTNTEIKKIDQDLKSVESLRPRNCDCLCRLPATTEQSDTYYRTIDSTTIQNY